MRRLRIHKAVLLICLCAFSCAQETVILETPGPEILAVKPEVMRAENDVIELAFSVPVINIRSMDACFRFAKSADVSPSLIQRAAKMHKSEAAGPFFPISITLSENRNMIFVKPGLKLDYNAEYSLWIFDCLRGNTGQILPLEEGNASFSVYRFKVEDGPFVLLSHDVILKGDLKVAPNRKHFSFQFSHKIAHIPQGAVRVGDAPLEVELSSDRFTLYASLPDPQERCERMQPDTQLQLVLSGLKDDAARTLGETAIAFQTDHECLLNSSSVLKNLQVQAYETHLDIAFDSLNLAWVHFNFATSDEKVSQSIKSKEQTLRVENLLQNALYQYELSVEDLFGQRQTVRGELQTRSVAKIAINEIMANPKTKKGQTDSNAEFIELYNYGDVPVDLSGFSIEIGSRTCAFQKNPAPGSLMLAPNAYMLLVGKKFDPMSAGINDGPAIYRMTGQSICGNLRNWPLPNVLLKDESKRIVDQFLGMPDPIEKGHSIERLNPSLKNGKEQFCYSRPDVGPTPLRVNGVAEKGCMQTQSKFWPAP